MSYILDALKRADAERERGHVPSLHTHNLPPNTRQTRQRAEQPSRALWWVAGAALVLIGSVLGWWWLKDSGTDRVVADPPPAAVPSAPMAPLPSAATEVSPTAPPSVAEGPTLPILAPEPPKPPPRRPVAPSKVAVTKTDVQADAKSAPAAASTPAAASASTTTAPAAAQTSTAAPTASIPHFGELSPEARARLPALSVSGATYSKNPALRMLIINGKVLQEGQEVAPGLKLETIEPRSAVMNHQGTRYRVGY
jgi:general secretion pathway protein B